MKDMVREFLRRGLTSCGLGPVILAMLYFILHRQGLVDVLTVDQVCVGILSITVLAFVAGGMNFLYQIERLPLMLAILIHGSVLYVSYLGTYLINGWLEWGAMPFLVFTGIFVLGYLAIWAVIYAIMRRRTSAINAVLQQRERGCAEPPSSKDE